MKYIRFKLLFILLMTSISTRINAQVSCNELMEYVRSEGYNYGSVNYFQLMSSEWLKEVTAYKLENTIVVIAEIKQDEYGFSTKEYIFCGIPEANWTKFTYSFYTSGKTTYGERFHMYILDYICNCE